MALKLLSESGCSRRVIEHCKTVTSLAVQIAEVSKKNGSDVDVQLVEAGALLHDIGRSKTHAVDHGIVGAKIAESLGLPSPIVSIIERHVGGGIDIDEAKHLGWPIKSYLPETLEEKIVCYADKLIEGKRRVRIRRTINKLSKELGKTHRSLGRIEKLHEELSSLTGDL
ncbi:MAG: TIGR00295 family protein [Candidatus Bathyarchaeota archaeon]|nr:MAG: TIGR00295 family protein [Candidatus Bathyarchaeota archaeon]